MNEFGGDMRKWYITKTQNNEGRWSVCPPYSNEPGWITRGAIFDTGAEALAAFARGSAE